MVTQSAFHVTAMDRKLPEISDFCASTARGPSPSRTREDTSLLNVEALPSVDSTSVPAPNSIEYRSRGSS